MIGWPLRRMWRLSILVLFFPLTLLRMLLLALLPRDLLVVRLSGSVAETSDEPAWRRFIPRKIPRVSLEEALIGLDEAGRDPKVKTVLIELDRPQLALIQAEELLLAIDKVKKTGRKVMVWADWFSGPALVVASAADKALGFPQGQLEFSGIQVRAMFIHDLLGLLGVVPQLDRHGEYKTMADMFMSRTMSAPHREMLADLGGDLFEQLITPLIMGRQLDREHLLATLEEAPVSHDRAVEQKVIDGVAYRDEMKRLAHQMDAGPKDEKDESGGSGEDEPPVCSLDLLLARRRRRAWFGQILWDWPRVQVIRLEGAISQGDSGRGCQSRPVVTALEDAQKDKRIKAVVLRIDSPGGSALASEEIWRAVRRLDAKKPVVASLGKVAASGGYYAAVGARRIIAHESTLTGSIGIVSGKFHLAPALRRWGIGIETISFGTRAGMMEPNRGFTEGEREALNRELMKFYGVFLERVAKGRNMTTEEVDALARGRVYTGRRALGLKLVDLNGGLDLALAEAAKLAELRPDAYEVEHVNPCKQGLSALMDASVAEGLGALCVAARLVHEPALAYCPWWIDGI